VAIADALIVDHQIASFAATECDDFVARHPNHFNVLGFGHAEHLQDEIGDLSRTLNLKNFVLFPVEIDLVWILRVAQLARTNLINCRQTLVLVIIETTSTEPLLQAFEMDVAARPHAVAGRNQRVLNLARLLLVLIFVFGVSFVFIGVVTEANTA